MVCSTAYPEKNSVRADLVSEVGHVHFKHNAGHNVLVPQPSNDPSDPLNWNPLWKAFAMGGMAISAFTMMCAPLSVAPQVPYYMVEFNHPLPDVIEFVSLDKIEEDRPIRSEIHIKSLFN